MKSESKFETVICPKCKAFVLDDNGKCDNCINDLSFVNGPTDSTHPDYLRRAEKSKFSWFIIKVALVFLLIFFVSLIVGLVLANTIPGCNCDESLRCSDCNGIDDLLTLLITGGFFGTIFSIMFILPATLVIVFLKSLIGKKK